MAAATRARRIDSSAEITVLESTEEYSRATCSLPYYVSGEIAHRQALTGIARDTLDEARIDLRLNARVGKIAPGERHVYLQGGSRLAYDRLIVCTGSRPKRLPTTFQEHPRLWQMRSVAQADAVRIGLAEFKPQSLAVIGGGYLGLEMAEVLTELGLKVTVFHRQRTLMRLFPGCHESVLAELAAHGVQIRLEHEVTLVDPDSRERTVEFRDHGGHLRCEGFDAVLLASGVEPNSELLAGAGARTGPLGGVLVDGRGETSLSGIYAAGDGVEIPSQRGGLPRFVPLATSAARLGRVCGENAAGGSLRLPESQACLAIRLFALQVAAVGHPADWAQAETHTIDFGQASSRFPRRRSGRATFLCEPGGGRLLGAQFVAPEGAALADLASMALSQRLTLSQLQDLDACYTPPLASLWHPFYLAARQAGKIRREVRA